MSFYSREKELKILREENWRGQAQLIVVYGRRRVGKTALVEEAYKKEVIWKFEGLEGVSEKKQILNFVEQLARYSSSEELRYKKIKDWRQALDELSKCLPEKKIVIFFDEFQWLANMKIDFVSLFKQYWDNHFLKYKNCRFVICGSVSSFIVRKVLHSRALYGRVDTEINLQPLTLKESSAFFPDRTPAEILEIYMTFGGIPKYFLELNPKLSYMQNLNEYAFNQNGYFFQEFGRLFISHLSATPYYEKILISLSNHVKNMTDLAKACQVTKGGVFSQILNDLALAGFIEKETPIDKSAASKIIHFRLLDEYLNFYFAFIFKNIPSIQRGRFLYHLIDSHQLKQWQGYAFERLCRRHADEIASYLRFSGIRYASGSWFRADRKKRKFAQVDLLFERSDKVLTVCEIKYVDKLLGQKITSDFDNRLETIREFFPSHSIQKILVLGKKVSLPEKLKNHFDEILWATEVFF